MVSLIKGLSVIGIGVFTLLWVILKIISCIFIAGYISTRLGLIGYYWWFSSILTFCILIRICVNGDVGKDYSKLDTMSEEDEIDVYENPIFEILRDYYGKYDCKIIFFDGTELIISKDNVVSYHENFLFLHENKEFKPVFKCFSITTIDTVIRLDKVEDNK